MTENTEITRIVVGVMPNQSDRVLLAAADLADGLGAEVACAYVDPSRYMTEFLPDGTVMSLPVDPEVPEEQAAVFPLELEERIRSALDARGIRWSAHALAGDPAQELAKAAERLGAGLIVVGTREAGFMASVEEFFTGAVGVHLAHWQPLPVVVVPLAPRASNHPAPWEIDQ